MKFRPARELLEDAMKEVVELAPTRVALTAHLQKQYDHYRIDPRRVEVKAYGFDSRIDWHTWLVTINGDAAGYTDQGLVD